MATLDQPSTQARYRVRYYDPRRGGVWTRTFFDAQKGAEFAGRNRRHAKPAKVEPVNPKAVPQ